MRRVYKRQGLIAEINISPFTDVILVLLMIFMIATPLISQNNISVKLPEASSKGSQRDSKQVLITISGEGIIYLENQLLTSKELKNKIDSLMINDVNTSVIVAADQSCRFQDVVRVMDILKDSGVKILNIATKTKS